MSITWYVKVEKYETSKCRVVSRITNYAELYGGKIQKVWEKVQVEI